MDDTASEERNGCVHVYTGTGKGKTTAALGLAMRAAGHGLRTLIVQFLKISNRYGELKAYQRLSPEIELVQKGKPCVKNGEDPSETLCDGCTACHIDSENPQPEDFEAARDAFEFAREKVLSGTYDIIILDEINYAVSFGLLPAEDVVNLIEEKPSALELVLTGRDAPREVIEKADYVTEMTEIKHPWKTGITARKGVEY